MSLVAVLKRSWWGVFPAFAAITVRLAFERTCGDPLLPGATADPAWGLPLALLYVLAHAWSLAAYLVTASRSQRLAPRGAAWREVWGRDRVKLALMAILLAGEHAPAEAWRAFGGAIGCRL
jgi:hypothetical protein